MEKNIGGLFPGGPSRRQGEPARDPKLPPQLQRVEDMERRRAERSVRRRLEARRRRLIWGLVGSLAAAGAIGVVLGLQSHTTADQIRAQQASTSRQTEEAALSREVNRTLLELWRMEDIEAARNSGRRR